MGPNWPGAWCCPWAPSLRHRSVRDGAVGPTRVARSPSCCCCVARSISPVDRAAAKRGRPVSVCGCAPRHASVICCSIIAWLTSARFVDADSAAPSTAASTPGFAADPADDARAPCLGAACRSRTRSFRLADPDSSVRRVPPAPHRVPATDRGDVFRVVILCLARASGMHEADAAGLHHAQEQGAALWRL